MSFPAAASRVTLKPTLAAAPSTDPPAAVSIETVGATSAAPLLIKIFFEFVVPIKEPATLFDNGEVRVNTSCS